MRAQSLEHAGEVGFKPRKFIGRPRPWSTTSGQSSAARLATQIRWFKPSTLGLSIAQETTEEAATARSAPRGEIVMLSPEIGGARGRRRAPIHSRRRFSEADSADRA